MFFTVEYILRPVNVTPEPESMDIVARHFTVASILKYRFIHILQQMGEPGKKYGYLIPILGGHSSMRSL